MRTEELAVTTGASGGLDDAAQGGPSPGLAPAPPSRLGAPYSEAWGYFHLAPARPGQPSGHWATCRLCGERVGHGPGLQAGTAELWRHLRGAHRRELEKSGDRRSPPPGPAAAEGDWARLLEQMGALAVRGSRRERELERREAAVQQGERALERRRRALQEEERAAARARRELQAEREALQARLRELQAAREALQRELGRREGAPGWALKADPDGDGDGCVVSKVLL